MTSGIYVNYDIRHIQEIGGKGYALPANGILNAKCYICIVSLVIFQYRYSRYG